DSTGLASGRGRKLLTVSYSPANRPRASWTGPVLSAPFLAASSHTATPPFNSTIANEHAARIAVDRMRTPLHVKRTHYQHEPQTRESASCPATAPRTTSEKRRHDPRLPSGPGAPG